MMKKIFLYGDRVLENIPFVSKEFGRYFIAGSIAFIFDISLLIFFTEVFNFYYLISGVIAFTGGLALMYFLSIWHVFKFRRLQNNKLEFFTFSLIGIFGLGANTLFLWLFTEIFTIYYVVSKVLSAGIVFSLNYYFRSYFLFR